MRNSFVLLGQSAQDLLLGQLVKIKDSQGTVLASTNPSGDQIEIYDNNDGNYWLEIANTFRGTVYVGESEAAQDEMTDSLFVGDDVLTHLTETGIHLTATEKSKVGNLPANTTDDIMALEDSLNTKASSTALNSLISTVAGKASSSPGTGMKAETGDKVAPNLHTDDLEVDDDGKIRVKQQFASESILSNSKNLRENLALLASAIENIEGISSGASVSYLSLVNRTTHITDVEQGTVAKLYFYFSDPVASTGTYGLYIAYNVDGTTQRMTIKETTWGGGSS